MALYYQIHVFLIIQVILVSAAVQTTGSTCLFRRIQDYALIGHNDKIYYNVTLSQCKDHCQISLTGCRSFDYNQGRATCYLSVNTADDFPHDMGNMYGFAFFEKVCGELKQGCMFYERENYARYGANSAFDTNITPEECKDKCLNMVQTSYADQVCYSFDYDTRTKTCFYEYRYGYDFSPESYLYDTHLDEMGPMPGSNYFERLCESNGTSPEYYDWYNEEQVEGYPCEFLYPPIFGQALEGHQYTTINETYFGCWMKCANDNLCKSFNYKITTRNCELNTETRRSKLGDFTHFEKSAYLEKDCDFTLFPTGCPSLEYSMYDDYCYTTFASMSYGPGGPSEGHTRNEAIYFCEQLKNHELMSAPNKKQLASHEETFSMIMMYMYQIPFESEAPTTLSFWTSATITDPDLDMSLFEPGANKDEKYVAVTFNSDGPSISLTTVPETARLIPICQTRRRDINCPRDLFQCSEVFDCIDPKFLCDSIQDCSDGTDESTERCAAK